MESNREEALRALDIARRKKAEGDIAGALKFAKKSQCLFSSRQTEAFLASLADTPSPDSTPFASGTSTPAPNGEGTTQHRKAKATEHRQGRQDSQYTVEQVAIVERVRKYKHHQYYEILELETKATDSEIKKSYRKLALQLHPDKNGAPGADEAFKMVSRAFQVLSDPDKRAAYDQHGDDPDSRTAGMGASPFGNGFPGMRTYGGRGMYGDEISPDELFNMFFGGGFSGGGFNAGTFGPGVRIHTFGGDPRHRRPQANAQPQGNTSFFYQLLPILILLLVTIIPTFFSGPSKPAPLPSFVLETANPPYTLQRLTPQHSIPYFVNPSEVSSLPKSRLRQLDNQAEVTFLRGLQHQCQTEYNTRQQKLADAQGWFGQIKDQAAWDEARAMRMGSCERLRQMGYRPDVY